MKYWLNQQAYSQELVGVVGSILIQVHNFKFDGLAFKPLVFFANCCNHKVKVIT